MNQNKRDYSRKCRFLIGFVIFGLLVSGLTAFPLLHEVNWITSIVMGADANLDPEVYQGWRFWLLTVREGLEVTYNQYPFIAYGTDWLAFGHVVIALFFILPFRDPLRYEGVLKVGVVACILVIPLALICGTIRGIPFYWRLIDCSFGILCIFPLVAAIQTIRKIEEDSPIQNESNVFTAG